MQSVGDSLAKHKATARSLYWFPMMRKERSAVLWWALCSLPLQASFSTSFEIHPKHPHLQRGFPESQHLSICLPLTTCFSAATVKTLKIKRVRLLHRSISLSRDVCLTDHYAAIIQPAKGMLNWTPKNLMIYVPCVGWNCVSIICICIKWHTAPDTSSILNSIDWWMNTWMTVTAVGMDGRGSSPNAAFPVCWKRQLFISTNGSWNSRILMSSNESSFLIQRQKGGSKGNQQQQAWVLMHDTWQRWASSQGLHFRHSVHLFPLPWKCLISVARNKLTKTGHCLTSPECPREENAHAKAENHDLAERTEDLSLSFWCYH